MKSEIVEQLFKHSAWANHQLFAQLSQLPDEALSLSGWNPEWTVGKLANHIVSAQGRMWARATHQSVGEEIDAPWTSAGMMQLDELSRRNDAKLFALLEKPNELMNFSRLGTDVQFMRSTILAQVVHHATEHRTQISDILAMNNLDVINLDSLDQWSFENRGNSH